MELRFSITRHSITCFLETALLLLFQELWRGWGGFPNVIISMTWAALQAWSLFLAL